LRIISKQHDYYDSVRIFGIDPNIVYVRKEISYDQSTPEYKNARSAAIIDAVISKLPHVSCYRRDAYISRAFVLIFCGKIFPCILYRYYSSDIRFPKKRYKYCYNLDSVEHFINKYGSKSDKRRFKSKSRYRMSTKRNMEELFKISGSKSSEFIDLHHNIGYPSLIIEPNATNQKHLIYNPILKDINFYRIFDTFKTFQELSMFIGGVMGGECPPMIEISDDIRFEEKGFDSKLSFRKEKEN